MDHSAMYQEVQNHEDTFLPTISIDMKEVFNEVQPYTTMNNQAASNVDSAAGGIPTRATVPTEETIIDSFNDIPDIDSWLSLLNSPKPSLKPVFSILPSKKERGKPYFIHDTERILTTKRNEPIHLQLDICKPGQKILLTLRYSDQDYYDRPMVCNGCSHAYKGCPSVDDHNKANFCVRSRDGVVEYTSLLDGDAYHPTAVITVAAKHEPVDLWAAFKCRNSCSEHKKYGGDRTLRLMLLDGQNQELCRNEWNLRVCESAKRDHNLVLSKAGSTRSDFTAVMCVPRQSSAGPNPTLAMQDSFAPVMATDDDAKPPPMKRVKLEEDPVIHYIDDASSSNQQTGAGPTALRCVPSPCTEYSSHAGSSRKNGNNTAFHASFSRSSGVVSVPGCFEAKPLLPIAPPGSAVTEAPAAVDVIPIMVYPKNEADKELLVAFAERLGMDVYNVKGTSPNH